MPCVSQKQKVSLGKASGFPWDCSSHKWQSWILELQNWLCSLWDSVQDGNAGSLAQKVLTNFMMLKQSIKPSMEPSGVWDPLWRRSPHVPGASMHPWPALAPLRIGQPPALEPGILPQVWLCLLASQFLRSPLLGVNHPVHFIPSAWNSPLPR